ILPWLGDGLLTSTGSKWHRHRKLLTPAFHFKILESFMDVFTEKSQMLVDILAKEANGKAFNVYPYITRCALDIISETAMGIQVNAMTQTNNTYVDAIYGLGRELVERFQKAWLSNDFIYSKTSYYKRFLKFVSILHNTTNRVINERKEALKHKHGKSEHVIDDDFVNKKRKAFLDLLLEVAEGGDVITYEQIREEVDTFLFEGHDTTTTSISWTLFLLGLYPNVQEKVYEEVSQFLQDDKRLSFADLKQLKYLERVIKESLRLYPSVPGISRLAAKDIAIEDYIIPAGTSINILIYDLHRNEKHFANPNKFDPDRFLPEICKDRHPYAYIPFSAGPRNCIGQKFALSEEKTVLSYIIRNYKIKSTQTMDNVRPISDLVLRPEEGIYIILEKRC
ncbi:cytochrome P450, partial [Oryctes borbonicus]